MLYAINSLLVVGLLCAYVSPFVNPSTTWFFSFFGLGFPFLMLANIGFFFFWLAFKPKYAWMSGLFLLLGIGPIQKAIGFNKTSPLSKGVTVMTYNIGKTRIDFHRKGKEKKIAAFKAFIEKKQPEIICVQERLPRHLKIYEGIFTDYELYPQTDIGTAIYSKYPIINGGNLPFNTKSHNATWADIKIGKQTFRFYSMHLSSNRVTNLTDDIKEIWDESKSILEKYHEHAIVRSYQLVKVLKHAKTSPHPVIINGDFNDVPQSYVYQQIAREYKDAFMEKGSGMMKTYNSRFPGLRIDYTFLSEEIPVLSNQIIRTNLSDHFPLVTTIAVNGDEI